MSQLKVTVKSITVHNNGDAVGKGELFWKFDIDGSTLVELPSNNPRKTRDGEVITLNESRTVNKTGNDSLMISGTVAERDGLTKNETTSFSQEFTQADGWGVGPHDVNRRDGRLDVTVRYEIANA